MTKKLSPSKGLATARISKPILQRLKTLAFWQEREMQEVLQGACSAYLTQRARKSFKKHVKKQAQQYGQRMLERALKDLKGGED